MQTIAKDVHRNSAVDAQSYPQPSYIALKCVKVFPRIPDGLGVFKPPKIPKQKTLLVGCPKAAIAVLEMETTSAKTAEVRQHSCGSIPSGKLT
jgi:hypothetical protein